MKSSSSEVCYDHPWETVIQAIWRKYPNPYKPEVVATDVIERSVKNRKLYTQRIIGSEWGFPLWAAKLVGGSNECMAYEYSEVDPIKRIMITRSRNLTLSRTLKFEEIMCYYPCPEDDTKTIAKQETNISVIGIPLQSYVENFLMGSNTTATRKGKQALDLAISKINIEVDELLFIYKKSSTEILQSIGEIKVTAKKSIDEISNAAIIGIDEINKVTEVKQNIPRV